MKNLGNLKRRELMKKLFTVLLVMAFSVIGCFSFSACNSREKQHEHNYTETIINPTCTEQGYTLHKCECGKEYKDTFVVALGHNYDIPTYVWNGQECTATRICKNDSQHKETETVTGIYLKDLGATCIACEKGHYKATFTNVAFDEQNTTANGVDKGTALEHNFEWIVDKSATKTETGLKHEKCTRCDATRNEDTVIPVLTCEHESVQKTSGKPATCSEQGVKDYWYCEDCQKYFSDETCQIEILINIDEWKIIPAINHDYDTPTYVWNGQSCTATRVCKNDSQHKETETVTGIYVKDTDATATTPEKGHYKAVFTNSAFSEQTTDKNSVTKGEPFNPNIETPIIEE